MILAITFMDFVRKDYEISYAVSFSAPLPHSVLYFETVRDESGKGTRIPLENILDWSIRLKDG